MKKKKYFNRIEGKILRILYQYKLPLTIYEVAKESGISYPTSKKYVLKLVDDKILLIAKFIPLTENAAKRYTFNFSLFEEEK